MAQELVLQVGEKLKLESGLEIQLNKKIGDGYTALVFLGSHINQDGSKEDIVVKIAKPNEDAERLVRDEGEVLRKLFTDLRIKNKPVTPRIYGQGKVNGSTFIAMEFIHAKPLMELEEGKPLPEKTALMAGLEMFDFLDKLHSEAMLAYPDMKAENFFWDLQEDSINLRVIDMGGLEKCTEIRKDPRYDRDVYRAAQYFFYLVSGFNLKTSWDFELEENPIIAINRMANVSQGLKSLLSLILARDPKYRLTDAQEVKLKIEGLLRFWTEAGENLINIALKNIALVSKMAPEDLLGKSAPADRASDILDIYLRRYPERKADAEGIRKQASDLSDQTNLLNRARANIRTKSLSDARNLLSMGEEISSTPEVFRRLGYVIEDLQKIAPDRYLEFFNLYNELVSGITQGYSESAKNVCADQQEQYPEANCFAYLIEDMNFLKNSADADKFELKEDYGKCITALKAARDNLSKLPADSKIARDNSESIDQRILRLEKKAEGKSNRESESILSIAEIDSLLARNDIDRLIADLFSAFRQNGCNDVIDQKLTQIISDFLAKGDIATANRFGNLVSLMPEHSAGLLEIRDIASLCSACEKSIQESSYFSLLQALGNLVKFPSGKGKPFAEKHLRKIVQSHAIDNDHDLMEGYLGVAKQVNDPALFTELTSRTESQHNRQVELLTRKLDDIEAKLLLDRPWTSRYESVLSVLQSYPVAEFESLLEQENERLEIIESQISKIAASDFLAAESKTRLTELKNALATQKKELAGSESLAEGRQKSIKDLQETFLSEWKTFYEQNEATFKSFAEPSDPGIAKEIAAQVTRFYKQMILIVLQTNDPAVLLKVGKQLYSALDYSKIFSSNSLDKIYEKDIITDDTALITEIEGLVRICDFKSALEKLETISLPNQHSEAVKQLREKILRFFAYSYQVTQKAQTLNRSIYDQSFVDLLQRNAAIHLPPKFFIDLLIPQYLSSFERYFLSEIVRYNVSTKTLIKDINTGVLIEFKHKVEQLVSIEAAHLAISK